MAQDHRLFASLPLKPDRELDFYVGLIRLWEASRSNAMLRDWLTCTGLVLANVEVLEGIESEMDRAAEEHVALWEQLTQLVPDAPGYAQVACGSYEAFCRSPYGSLSFHFLADVRYFKQMGGVLTEADVLVASARMLLLTQPAESEAPRDMPDQLSRLNAVLLQAKGMEFALARMKQGDLDTQLYVETDQGFEQLPLEQCPLPSERLLLMIEPSLGCTILYRLSPDGQHIQYWVAANYVATVTAEGVPVLGSIEEYETFSLPVTPPLADVQITAAMRAQWPHFKQRARLLMQRHASKVDQVNWQSWHAMALAQLLDSLEPPLSKHVKYICVGYTLAAMGLLEPESSYLDTDRKSTYREYLRSSVMALVKRTVVG